MTAVFTIDASYPFAKTLAEGIIARYGSAPMALAQIRLFLPNRRSMQAVKEAFLRATGGKALLLPHMSPLGDLDETLDELFWCQGEEAMHMDVPVSASEEQVILAKLIQQWQQPAMSFSQSLLLAGDLSRFLAEVSREQLTFTELQHLVPEELSKHWQLTLDFLAIVIELYPKILEDRQRKTQWDYRNDALAALAKHWQAHPPEFPVIAAGTTGSIPATAQLLKVISQLPEGMIILPGLDTTLSKEKWEAIDPPHPQYGLKTLLATLDVNADQVMPWQTVQGVDEQPSERSNTRAPLLQQMMLPAAVTTGWHQLAPFPDNILNAVNLLEADTQQEEALAIAIYMRHTLETPEKTAALVTHDLELARMVSSYLLQWQVMVDNSAGRPLAHIPPLVFMQAIADAVLSSEAPVQLLELLKHPLCCVGGSRREHLAHTRALETLYLRGIRIAGGLADLIPVARKEQPKLAEWLQEVHEHLQPLRRYLFRKDASLAQMLKVHVEIAASMTEQPATLWQGDEGTQGYETLLELIISGELAEHIVPAEYHVIFSALLQGRAYRPRYGTHPRLAVLSPIEARMQQFDCVILGGLNEGSWPPAMSADPWMSRPMRIAFGLPEPERKIGMAAHDFVQLIASAPEVLLTRAHKVEGTQTLPCRWLLRLETVLKATGQIALLHKSSEWLALARAMLMVEANTPCQPPAPKPPREARPDKLSVTAIERLMRDPYHIYARSILKLEKLDELDQDPGPREFGVIIHDIMEEFVGSLQTVTPDAYLSHLLQCGREVFARQALRPAIISFWWPRFEKMAAWLAENEMKRQPDIKDIALESWGEYHMTTSAGTFKIYAKADRIEQHHDDSVWFIDYKTGAPPTKKDIHLGYASQLTLEALIFTHHGFELAKGHDEKQAQSHLQYWKLSASDAEQKPITDIQEVAMLVEQAEEGVLQLVEAFMDEGTAYLPTPNPAMKLRYNDYEHLARQKEWEGDL